MKTLKQAVIEQLNQEHFGHPSREEQFRISNLESIVKLLASEIDKLNKKNYER